MATRKPIKPAGQWVSPYFSPAIQSGQFLFLSGAAALDDDWNVMHPGNCGAQSELVMQRIKQTLESAGGSLNDVVKTTTFLMNTKDYPAYNEVRSRYFPKDPPASSTVIVADLVVPGLLVEIEAVAILPEGK